MKNSVKYIFLILTLIIISCSVFAKDLTGNVESIDFKTKKINIISNGKTYNLSVNSKSKLYRSLINTQILEVDILSVSPGDAAECSFDDSNIIEKGTFTFDMVKGTIQSINNNELTLTDGQKIKISEKASISLEKGVPGKIKDLTPGLIFVARINPNTHEIWTLVVSGVTKITPVIPDNSKNNITPAADNTKKDNSKKEDKKNITPIKNDANDKNTVVTPVIPATNRNDLSIDSVEIGTSNNTVSGDKILIKVCGTSHCGVSADIQYVANTKITLKEDTPGVYTEFITVPEKNLNKAKIMVYMSKAGKNISKESNTLLSVNNKKCIFNTLVISNDTQKTENIPEIQEENKSETTENSDALNTDNTSDATNSDNSSETAEKNEETITTEPEKKVIDQKESEQINENKDSIDQNTNTDSITGSFKDSNAIKLDEIKIVSPQTDILSDKINISGLAIPNSKISVKTVYTNEKYGVLGINGVLHEETINVNEDGIFNYGPIDLAGFLNTPGLVYYIELKYADEENSAVKTLRFIKE